jgi:sugar transferase (PEP-CTERM/EpsH1 system associated)
MMRSYKILILTPQFPYPPHQGTTMRNYNLIAGLAKRHEVHLISFGDPASGQYAPLDGLCQSVQVVPNPDHPMSRRLRCLLLSQLPDMAVRLPSRQFSQVLADTIRREAPDIVEIEGIELAQYLFQVSSDRGKAQRPLIVYDDHNAEYVLQQRAFETDVSKPQRWVAAAYSFVQWRRLRRYERQACQHADRLIAVSQTDASALRRLDPRLDPVVVPNGVDMAFYTASIPSLQGEAGPGDTDLVFTGKMDFRPNVDAVLWFARQVLPLIRRQSPETRFWIVGKDPHPRLDPLDEDPAVVVTGFVDDQRPYIAGAGIYVIPLRIGGGTRLKVLEAMAMSRAIVSTTLGCEGFEVESGRELVTADTPEDFAAKVVALLNDPDRRAQLGTNGRNFAESGYDWQIVVPLLEQAYQVD